MRRGSPPNPFGTVAFTAIGNLTKSVTIGSENPNANRGHLMVMNGGRFVSEHSSYAGMGRTSAFVQISDDTNQIGRYALHAHRHTDPEKLRKG